MYAGVQCTQVFNLAGSTLYRKCKTMLYLCISDILSILIYVSSETLTTVQYFSTTSLHSCTLSKWPWQLVVMQNKRWTRPIPYHVFPLLNKIFFLFRFGILGVDHVFLRGYFILLHHLKVIGHQVVSLMAGIRTIIEIPNSKSSRHSP